MKRHINLYYDTIDTENIDIENISIKNIDSIINHSVDILYCNYLEYIEKDKLETIFGQLLKKIRPYGSLSIKFVHAKTLCQNYISNTIPAEDLLNALNGKKNLLSFDLIYSFIDPNLFKILKYDTDGHAMTIILQRVNI